MPSSGYTAISFTAGEQPTTAKWNLVGSNDASFNTGNGFNDGIIVSRHLATGISVPDVMLNPYKFLTFYTGGGTIPNGSYGMIPFGAASFDTGSNFSATTHLFTAPVAGYYHFFWRASHTSSSSSVRMLTDLYKNGAQYARGADITGEYAGSSGTADILLAANDTIGIYAETNTTSVTYDVAGDACYFGGCLMSAS